MYWLAIDLDELPELDRNLRLFRHNRRALVSIMDRDYGGPGGGSIGHRVRQLLDRAEVGWPISRIELMTIPRIAGYVFNPVSFYLCSSDDGTIRTLVAEVRNTFGEKHHYVAGLEAAGSAGGGVLECRIPKRFYVSPFFRVDGQYHIRLHKPGDALSIEIDLEDETGLVFSASMSGVGAELNARNLRRSLLRLPLFAATTMLRIHWQALQLYCLKGLTMFEKPPPSHASTIRAARSHRWVRLRTACVRFAARRRSRPDPASDVDFGPKES